MQVLMLYHLSLFSGLQFFCALQKYGKAQLHHMLGTPLLVHLRFCSKNGALMTYLCYILHPIILKVGQYCAFPSCAQQKSRRQQTT